MYVINFQSFLHFRQIIHLSSTMTTVKKLFDLCSFFISTLTGLLYCFYWGIFLGGKSTRSVDHKCCICCTHVFLCACVCFVPSNPQFLTWTTCIVWFYLVFGPWCLTSTTHIQARMFQSPFALHFYTLICAFSMQPAERAHTAAFL